MLEMPPPHPTQTGLSNAVRIKLASLVVIALAIAVQSLGHLNGDIAWFMTFAEKFLDGFQPYVEVSDPNPPAAFLVYVPAILFARMSGLRPELVVGFLTFLSAGLSLLICERLLQGASLLSAKERDVPQIATPYLLAFVPAFCFAEREHLALIAVLPYLVALMARSEGQYPLPASLWAAGLGAALCAAFKPYYLLPMALAAAYPVWRRQDWRLLFVPENLLAAGVYLVYLLLIVICFPAYVSKMLPIVADIYTPVRDDISHILFSPLLLINGILLTGLALTAVGGSSDGRTSILAIASFGFLLTFIIQGKGWMNHAYPGLALALLACVFFFASSGALVVSAGRWLKIGRFYSLYIFVPMLCLAPFLFGLREEWPGREEYPGLTETVAKAAPTYPKIATLAEQLDLGHPLVRHLNGVWVGRQNALWISWGAKYLLARGQFDQATRDRLTAHIHEDEDAFAFDLAQGHPDVLLIESPALENYARKNPRLAGIFKDYQPFGKVGSIGIFTARSAEPLITNLFDSRRQPSRP